MGEHEEKRRAPTKFVRFEQSLNTSMRTAVVMTDAGRAYLKGLGNPEGPHALVCEYVGTSVARLLGLKTLEVALIQIAPGDEIPLFGGGLVAPGPAYVTREVPGHVPWSGTEQQLRVVENIGDLARLVVFDTWLRNVDRCPPTGSPRRPNYDNVLLAPASGTVERYHLFAIDHTHCISQGAEIGQRLGGIEYVKDDRVYGAFGPFENFVTESMIEDALRDLSALDKGELRRIVDSLPPEWSVDDKIRNILFEFLCRRADYLCDAMINLLRRVWRARARHGEEKT